MTESPLKSFIDLITFDQGILSLEQANAELQQKLNALQQDRPAKEQLVPQEWLDKYASMRSKVENPVVPVAGDSCSACYYMISAPDLQALRRQKLVQCKDCYRFLY